ncbi:YphA family membrane protein [Heyndrickxia sp. NPDC080065]|uniref:YphA family membrane protein n=1 Tax=Heyndrickxia sp. NPDC080065 TaxID=3390568 RepID=UPI003CFCBF13
MSGFYFIFFLWNVWIFSTFILNKQNKLRIWLAFYSLILLILFPYKVNLFTITFQIPSLVILTVSYYYLTTLSFLKKMYMIISIFIMMTGFSGFLLLELYDPVWVLVDRRILLGGLVFLISQLLLSRSIYSQIICSLLGTLQGEIIYSLILKKWGFPYIVGSSEYLDVCSVFLSLIIVWSFINHVSTIMSIKNSLKTKNKDILGVKNISK